MQTYLSKFSGEELIALAQLARELGYDRHQEPGMYKLMSLGPGRVMLKFYKAIDAADDHGSADFIEDVEGNRYVRIDGWESQCYGDPVATMKLKWIQRARFYIGQHHGELQHISDWLYMCALGAQAWTAVVDEYDRPLKLMKCGSLERLLHEADKHMLRVYQPNGKLASVRMDPGHEHHVVDLGLGYTLVELLTVDALAVEGAALRHCIGGGVYNKRLVDGYHSYYSIRDEGNTRLATIELHMGVIEQFRSKVNSTPKKGLVDMLNGVRSDLGWRTPEEYMADRKALSDAYLARPRQP